jgi:GGDEF domain-containing protein
MTATLNTLAWRVVSAALSAAGGTRGVLYMYDPQMDELRLAAATGLLDKALEHRINRGSSVAQQVSPGQGPAGDVLLTGLPRVVSDEQLSAPGEWWPDTTHPESVVFLPLQTDGEVVAVLGLCGGRASTSLDDVSKSLLELLHRGAIALKRARLLEAVVVDGETGLYEGQFVEALLGDAIRRSDDSDARVTVVTLRVGESSTHRGAEAGAPPILEIADALAAAAEQDLDVVGHLGHGRFVAILEDTGADVAHTLVENFLASVGSHRTDVAVHAAAVVERRVGEKADSVWARAHDMLMRIYDEGPGLRIGVATQVRERVMREHVPSFVTPVAPDHR